MMLNRGHDPRYVLCRRPVVITGGELAEHMLEVQYDPATRQYRAPLQLKANGGIFILDDLGRQRIPPATLLNRWIVPMEEKVDYLSLSTGQHFRTPFDVVLVFSTNLRPEALVDDAFLRRIGYKIEFQSLAPAQYHAIWQRSAKTTTSATTPRSASSWSTTCTAPHARRSCPATRATSSAWPLIHSSISASTPN